MHYFRSHSGIKNFGDELSPILVELVSKRKVRYCSIEKCELIGLGSIFDGVLKKLWKRKLSFNTNPIHVWGSGFIQDKPINKNLIKKNFVVHSIRGKLTQQMININNLSYGDPGLLSKFLIQPQNKKIKILIIPHIMHRALPEIKQFINSFSNCQVADLTGDPIEILRQISSSEIVISSSLHGLICADSFGIPNIRLKTSQELKGGDFKFNDYYSSLDRNILEITTQDTKNDILKIISNSDFSYQAYVDTLCEKLYQSFPSYLK
ncbi:MAG: polysaccharide pyruvyl transferase family protein [Sulfurovaceae bacterium]|nr:polysaccharide pyruvyl transferase family protein [Sulfurovaceae bacterium]